MDQADEVNNHMTVCSACGRVVSTGSGQCPECADRASQQEVKRASDVDRDDSEKRERSPQDQASNRESTFFSELEEIKFKIQRKRLTKKLILGFTWKGLLLGLVLGAGIWFLLELSPPAGIGGGRAAKISETFTDPFKFDMFLACVICSSIFTGMFFVALAIFLVVPRKLMKFFEQETSLPDDRWIPAERPKARGTPPSHKPPDPPNAFKEKSDPQKT